MKILKSFSSKILGVTYVIIFPISKFVASIVISISFGISTSDFDTPRLSCNPGIAIPAIIVLLPSSTTFPDDIVTFLALSFLIIPPVTTTKGTYILTLFPLTFTVLSSLFVY